MNKAGIITLYGNYNYGNRLQNFAVQEFLKRFGLEPHTIKYVNRNEKNLKKDTKISKAKLEAFQDFNKNIKFYDKMLYMEKDVEAEFGNDLDYYVIGSDQVWNYTFDDEFSPKMFANFANENQKRIAISASIGVSNVPDKESIEYKIFEDNLDNMDFISIREEVGRDIINEISQRRDVKVLLDPTMLLETEEWERVIKRPKNLKTDNFIVKSFLGKLNDDAEKALEKFAKENDCEILDISSEDSPYFDIGPAEFLYLEKNAKLVATDSFHSCVFAILFKTPFIVLERDDRLTSMYSRIETLLNTFELEFRKFNGEITFQMINDDYSKANEVLKIKRKEAMDFFSEVFEEDLDEAI